MKTVNGNQVGITWEYLYDLEKSLNVAIGGKQRFISLSFYATRLIPQRKPLKILDGGGCNFSSHILKSIFVDCFVASINIDGTNDVADVSVTADLGSCEEIAQYSGISKFDVIFLGEVFEHLVKPYSTLNKLMKLLELHGHLIISTPNLANMYNRFLLLFGRPLFNYRPLGVLPCDDHVTVVTRAQMVNFLREQLKLEVILSQGYSYYEQRVGLAPQNHFARSGMKLRFARKIASKILPTTLSEGILYIARKAL